MSYRHGTPFDRHAGESLLNNGGKTWIIPAIDEAIRIV
jgi:hypothetical protein